jgi:ribosomal protein S18 acetylase RimI-like enzyme
MKVSPHIAIIPYEDRYAHETVTMWRKSKHRALGIEEIHNFADHVHFLCTRLIQENHVYLAIDIRTDTVAGMMATDGRELNQLYIHIAYQRQGIGSQLLNIAKAHSTGTLNAFVFEVNTGARAFYEKYGFRIIGRGYENEEKLPDLRYIWTKDGLASQ